MRGSIFLLLLLALPGSALAQTGTPPIPEKHIPAPVLMELRALENQFDLALVRNCAPERCASKGCVYRDHVAVDQPRSGSLPGLGQTEGIGSVPVQEYLTQARCDFAHEKSVSARDSQALVKRLEQLLSKGWLQVTVGHQLLEPISPALSESPPPKPEPQPAVQPPAPAPAPEKPEPPAEWDAKIALRELWVALLPHFAWMIALFLATLAALVIIWAARRLGRETLEEKAMAAQLAAGSLDKPEEKPEEPDAAAEPPPGPPEPEAPKAPTLADLEEKGFVDEQRKLWADRVSQAELSKDEGGVAELLRDWLRERELPLLAKAILTLGEKVTLTFPSDGQLAAQKVELADYLRDLDEKDLPSDAQFFRKLNHHALSSSLLSQSDAETYRSLSEEFGTTGLAELIERLPARHAALLFAMVPADCRAEVARTLPAELRLRLSEHLLSSNRISREEQEELFSALDSARAGLPLPKLAEPSSSQITDRGRELDAAGALSTLFPHLEEEARRELLGAALQRSSGVLPQWYEEILYPEMLMKLPKEIRSDLLLEVDVRGLAGWSSMQPAGWQESFLSQLAPTMQNAVRANQAFVSRAEQLRLAQRGHDELVAALQRLAARGKVSFSEILA